MAHVKARKLLDEAQSIVRQLDFDADSGERIFDYFVDTLSKSLLVMHQYQCADGLERLAWHKTVPVKYHRT